jgi:ribose transport system substrate-binding protein
MNSGFHSCRVAPARRLVTGLVALVLATLAPGCKGGGSTSESPPAASGAALASASPTPVDPEILTYAQKQIDLAYAGTDRDPPTSAPKPQRGKNVWIISPSQIGESASVATNAAKEAGELVGWKMTLYDAKGDPSNFSSGIRQAIAAKADGIILHAIDCAWVKQALVEAQAANVKTLAYYALDCDDPSVKGEPLYSGSVNFGAQFGD